MRAIETNTNQMKKIIGHKTLAVIASGALLTSSALFVAAPLPAHGQTAPQIIGVYATPEKAIQIHWTSTPHAVYEIDYTDSLFDTNTGSITWNILYDEYPSHGTNTFVTDCGNHDTTPGVPHPVRSPNRFYRVTYVEDDTLPTPPTVAITAPASGQILSGNITVQVSADSPDILSGVQLYVDGEEQRPSGDDANFVINTCEWPNGNHVIFAVAKSQSGPEGAANGGVIHYAHAVSSYVNVTFNNLISRFDFSQPFFEPALGQTQAVTAVFAANCDWTLRILDVNSHAVRTATGSGNSMAFNWDGTGDGGVSIPDGVYTYSLSAKVNGLANTTLRNSSVSSAGLSALPAAPALAGTELWAASGDGGAAVPLALYPPGVDTSSLTLFSVEPSPVRAAFSSSSKTVSLESANANPAYSGPPEQSTTGPTRDPNVGVKGTAGTFGICYRTYGRGGFSSPHPLTGWPYPMPTQVAIDGQLRTDKTVNYTIAQAKPMAKSFAKVMKSGGWKAQFIKANDQWNSMDLEKSALGGRSIFNTCNFGLLIAHGSYANDDTTGADSSNVHNTYIWLGANDTVRLGDMDFGSPGTNGLRWMTILACNVLRQQNYNSMRQYDKIPVNENLHLLLGFSSTGYADPNLGKYYASYMVYTNAPIITSLVSACHDAYTKNPRGITNAVTIGVTGWDSCMQDRLTLYNDPDLIELKYYQYPAFTPQ